MYFINNLNRLSEGVFKNINYVTLNTEYDEDGNDIETRTFSRHDQREDLLKKFSITLTTDIISNPEIISAIKNNFKDEFPEFWDTEVQMIAGWWADYLACTRRSTA